MTVVFLSSRLSQRLDGKLKRFDRPKLIKEIDGVLQLLSLDPAEQQRRYEPYGMAFATEDFLDYIPGFLESLNEAGDIDNFQELLLLRMFWRIVFIQSASSRDMLNDWAQIADEEGLWGGVRQLARQVRESFGWTEIDESDDRLNPDVQ